MPYSKLLQLLSALRKELKAQGIYNNTTRRHLGGLEKYISNLILNSF